jgi:hypothetical protein
MLLNELEILNHSIVIGQTVWLDLRTRHHLMVKTDSAIFKLQKNIYLDTAHSSLRTFEVTFHPFHLSTKTF